jgi:hypothetical protein
MNEELLEKPCIGISSLSNKYSIKNILKEKRIQGHFHEINKNNMGTHTLENLR